jgi:hypothetical protein
MTSKETTQGGSVEKCDVPERSTYEDKPAKMFIIESRVFNGDTSVVVAGAQKMKSEPLGCCRVPQLQRNMRQKEEVEK